MSARRRWRIFLTATVAASLFLLPATPSAEAQYRVLSGPSAPASKGFRTPGIGLSLDQKFRHGALRPGRVGDRHSRPAIDKRFRDSRDRTGRFDPGEFRDGHKRRDFRKRIDRRFGHGFAPTYGSYYRRDHEGEDSNYESPQDANRNQDAASEAAGETQPPSSPPVTPKWIRVDVRVPVDGSSTGADAYAQGQRDGTCRDRTTEITVNGQPIEAYREDCAG